MSKNQCCVNKSLAATILDRTSVCRLTRGDFFVGHPPNGWAAADLRWLKRKSLDDALAYLRSLPFVGEKVARCVAMYCLDADISPMDTHATRILARIGVLPRNLQPKRAHDWIDRLVTPGSSYRLHVNLVAHGQRCCRPISPCCRNCPINHVCRYFRTGR